MSMSPKQTKFTFQGFENPTTTPVPDVIFDELMSVLTDAELRVLLYIVRRTFGFKKVTDNISLKQMVDGIRTKEGRALDSGAGISKASAARGIKGLVEKGIIITTRNRSPEKGDEPTTYTLRFKDSPLSHSETGGGINLRQGGVSQRDTQQTVIQETVRQHTDVVVRDALEKFGLSKKAAAQLVKKYPEAYLISKLEFVEWLVNTHSPLVSKNPAGYLRLAIEDDYQPPRKYQSLNQRSVGKQTNQRGTAVDHQTRVEAEEKYKRLREEAKQRILQEYPPEPIGATALTTESAWQEALSSLEQQVPAPTYTTWLKDTLLLKMEEDTAFVLVASRVAKEWLERRLYQVISRTLEQVLGHPVEVEFEVSQPTPG